MGFLSWLTGRDEKESDVYANFDKVDTVVSSIKSISTNEVASAKDAVHEAINALNNVNGLSTYVGSVDTGAFDGVFESIATSITQIGDQLQNKANDIKEYEESEWYEKLGSTFAMAGAKFGEGILSVAEDIGDGVVSIVGWALPKDSKWEKACADFVEKEWSHDAFNFYYNSDFAKKSAFTEDSGAAAAFKIAGSTTGYLALGGFASGAGGAVAAKTVGSTSKVGKVAHAAGTFMKSTTRMNTVTAALSGMGSGTEAGLHAGLSFDEAAWQGAKQGAVQGGIAWGMGKLGERSATKKANAQIEQGKQNLKAAEEKLSKASKDMVNPEYTQGMVDQAKNTFQQAQDEIISAKAAISQGEKALANVQGYSDAITKAGQKAGVRTVESAANFSANVASKGGVIAAAKDTLHGVKQSAGETIKNAGTTVGNGVKAAPGVIKKAATETIKHPIQTAGNVLKTTGKVAATTATTAAKVGATVVKSPAGVGAIANATGREMVEQFGNSTKASTQFRVSTTPPEDVIKPGTGGNAVLPNNPINGGGNTGGGGTPNNPGGNTGGNSGYVPSTPIVGTTPGNSTQQFQPTGGGEEDPKTPTPEPTNPSEPTTPTPQNPTPTNPDTPSTPTNPDTPTPTPTPETPNNNPIVTPPSNNGGNNGTTQHTGGGFGDQGYTSYTGADTPGDAIETPGDTTLGDELTETTTSIDDVIKGSKYTKIPTSSKPITSSSSSSGGGAVIPIAAGLSAAAAAGIGAKVYMDRKKNNENGEYDEIDTEEWSGEDTLDLDYDDSSDTSATLDDDDDYGYQATESEKYDARNNEELADLQ